MTLHKQDSNGWTRNSGRYADRYNVQMNGYQLDIIHCAVKEYLDVHRGQMTEGEVEEVEAIRDMSDLQHEDEKARPAPLPILNGWLL